MGKEEITLRNYYYWKNEIDAFLNEKEDKSNKTSSWNSETNDNRYPTEKLVKTTLDTKENTSNKTSSWNSTTNNTRYPTEKLVKTSLDGKINTSALVNDLTTGGTSNVLSAEQGKVLKGEVDGKSDLGHTHDDRYYTESEIDNKLASKENNSNKTLIWTNTPDNTRYPTEKLVKDSLDGKSDTDHTHPNATSSSNGLMSSDDKAKLDGIASGANAYTHPSYTARTGKPTGNQTPAFGGTATVSQITSDASGHVTGATDRTIKIPNTEASTTASGLMSKDDKTKLDGISTGAKNVSVEAKGSGTIEIAQITVDGTTTSIKQRDNNTTYTAASATPNMDGTGAVGTSSKYAREDHVHPTDTSRASTTVTDDLQTQINNITTGVTPTDHNHDSQYIKTGTGTVTTTNIANGTIKNEDISTSAAIAQSKINNLTNDLAAKNVTLTKLSTPTNNTYIATYEIKQGETSIGKIDIPKDFLIQSASLEHCTTANTPLEGLSVGDPYIHFVANTNDGTQTARTIDINVKDLVDTYKADNSTLQLNTSTNTFSIKSQGVTTTQIKNGTIINEDISSNAAISQSKIDGLITDLSGKSDNGHTHSQYLTSHQDISGKENTSNKTSSWSSTTNDTRYPTEKLVKTSLDAKENTSNKSTSITSSSTDTQYPSAKAVYGYAQPKGNYLTSHNPIDTALNSTSTNAVQNKVVNSALSGKAPTSHASTATTYGAGNASNYGHVKVSDNILTSAGNASQSVAASSKAVKDVYDIANPLKERYDGKYIAGAATVTKPYLRLFNLSSKASSSSSSHIIFEIIGNNNDRLYAKIRVDMRQNTVGSNGSNSSYTVTPLEVYGFNLNQLYFGFYDNHVNSHTYLDIYRKVGSYVNFYIRYADDHTRDGTVTIYQPVVNSTESYTDLSEAATTLYNTSYTSTSQGGTYSEVTNTVPYTNINANSFIKRGGTATQLLLANGSTKETGDFATSGHTHTKSQITDFPTSMTPTSHNHGSLANGGTLNSDITSVNKIAVTDSSNNLKTIGQLPYSKISGTPTIPSKTSQLTNDSGFLTSYTPPTGSTSQAGIVKLNTSTSSTSTTEAATPSAVKSAYDLANGKPSLGTTASTAAKGNHTHGNITTDGKLGSASDFVITDSSKKVTTNSRIGNMNTDGKIMHTVAGVAVAQKNDILITDSNGVIDAVDALGNITYEGKVGTSNNANKNVVTNSNGVIITEDKNPHTSLERTRELTPTTNTSTDNDLNKLTVPGWYNVSKKNAKLTTIANIPEENVDFRIEVQRQAQNDNYLTQIIYTTPTSTTFSNVYYRKRYGSDWSNWQKVLTLQNSANDTASNIKINGTQSAGSLNTFARADHVHPVDTSRAASSHTHGNITNAGAIGSAANKPIITTTSGKLTAGSFGTTANTFCQGNDSRLSDARTPLAHTHKGWDQKSSSNNWQLYVNSDLGMAFFRYDAGVPGALSNNVTYDILTSGATVTNSPLHGTNFTTENPYLSAWITAEGYVQVWTSDKSKFSKLVFSGFYLTAA